MKKIIFVSGLLLAVAACGSAENDKRPDASETGSTPTGSSATMPDTTVTSNQSGATGNGGVGTGAVNQTGEESSGTGEKKQKQ